MCDLGTSPLHASLVRWPVCRCGSSGLDGHFRAWGWKNAKQQDRRSQKPWRAKQEHSGNLVQELMELHYTYVCVPNEQEKHETLVWVLSLFLCRTIFPADPCMAASFSLVKSLLKCHLLLELFLTTLICQGPCLPPYVSTTSSMLSSLQPLTAQEALYFFNVCLLSPQASSPVGWGCSGPSSTQNSAWITIGTKYLSFDWFVVCVMAWFCVSSERWWLSHPKLVGFS